MRKLVVSSLVSLDGVIQDPGGFGETEQGGWANGYFDDEARQAALDHLLVSDYFLAGRVSFELMRKSWAGIKGAGPYLDRMDEIPKLVASNTLTGPLDWNATVISGDIVAELKRLKEEGGGDIVSYGSATLVQTLIRHDLVDEFQFGVHPLVLGSGKRLFPDGGVPVELRLTGTHQLATGVVTVTYVPAGRE